MIKSIFFGAGQVCQTILKNIRINENVVVVVDNDKEKWGKKIEGKEVVSPSKIKDYEYEMIIIIANAYDEIKKDLVENYGVSADKIDTYKNIIPLTPKNIGTIHIDWDKGISCSELYNELCKNVEQLGDMEKIYLLDEHNRSFKWLHYFEVYTRHLEKYRGKDVTIVEIGVNKGGSLQVWKKYFGKKANIVGVDITPECKNLEEDQIKIYIGSQSDREFLNKLKNEVPKIDILIDDGGHYMDQQIITFEEMFDHIADDGIYICEDTHTSYDAKKYDSGYKKDNTYIEYSKNFIDYIHAWFSQDERLKVDKYTRSMHSIHYYTNCVVVEKQKMYRPFDMEVTNKKGEDKNIVFHMRGKDFEE